MVRPLSGDLFIMGYDTTASTAQLYTVDTTTAIATPVGASAIYTGSWYGKCWI
ncbi:MAG: hypothetical protein IPF75_07610 [Bacteroidetes bacterium]|nr:hypothetical protein [Bacteroidota bacterium]